MLFFAAVLFAQQPVITFTTTEHDFGKINEADGRVSTIFEFKNEGMEPLVLSNVKASCGCTTPTWTKTPVEPGQTGAITVTYNPNGRPGRFQKTITVTSNATEGTKKLFIKGEVIPKAAKPVNKYPVKIGELSVSANNMNFGTVLKGKAPVKAIEYANLTDQDIVVDVFTGDQDPILAQASLTTIKKGESGQIDIRFDAAAGKVYGPQEYKIYVVLNGKKQLTDEFAITVRANVEEDFSTLTPEQLQNAPILEVKKEINLGAIVPGKEVKKAFTFKNAGADPMFVRCIVNNNTALFRTVAPTKAVKSGKTGQVVVKIDGKNNGEKLAPGAYRRSITLMTNDPKTPKQNIVIVWTVEE